MWEKNLRRALPPSGPLIAIQSNRTANTEIVTDRSKLKLWYRIISSVLSVQSPIKHEVFFFSFNTHILYTRTFYSKQINVISKSNLGFSQNIQRRKLRGTNFRNFQKKVVLLCCEHNIDFSTLVTQYGLEIFVEFQKRVHRNKNLSSDVDKEKYAS